MRAKLEVVFVPVTDVDRAKEFYAGSLGWTVDYDEAPFPGVRFVQITPPDSACSIAFGEGISTMTPGSLNAGMLVIDDAAAAHAELTAAGVDATPPDPQSWGTFVTFTDPDGNEWRLQELPKRQ